MSSEKLQILLMGYLDGELSDEERARVEQALEEDPELRAELAQMKGLVEMTAGWSVDQKSDAELEAFWGGIYNRLERHVAWMLLLGGLAAVFFAGVFAFLTDPDLHWGLRLATAIAGVGLFGLLLSVWRERRKVLPHDRYTNEVHR